MSALTITVPYIYEISLIKPRCRKPVTLLVRDTVTVQIEQRTSEEMPVAITCKFFDKEQPVNLHWDGQSLFKQALYKNMDDEEIFVTIEQFVANASTGQGDSDITTAPFYKFWSRGAPYVSPLRYASLSDDVADGTYATLGDLEKGRHQSDNRAEMIEWAKAIAARYVVVDGILMVKAAEPMYQCVTFGLGMNHASTALMDGRYSSNQKPESCYFNLLQRDEAIEYTSQVAKNRGDTNSLPIKPHTEFTVLIPDAVRMPANPFKKESV